jgi:hypothetical protein
LRGAGSHRLELRSFNCTAEETTVDVSLKAGEPKSLKWKLEAADSEKPWVLIVIPNGMSSHKQEVFGTVAAIDDKVLSV